jgi:hypothetical protein
MSTLRNWLASNAHADMRAPARSAFGPWRASLAAASAADSPDAEDDAASIAAPDDNACHAVRGLFVSGTIALFSTGAARKRAHRALFSLESGSERARRLGRHR